MTTEREAMTERQAFEKAILSLNMPYAHPLAQTPDGEYTWEITHWMWQLWKSHLSRAAAEPVLFIDGEDLERMQREPMDYFPRVSAVQSLTTEIPMFVHPPEPALDVKITDDMVLRGVKERERQMGMSTDLWDETRAVLEAAMQVNPDAKENEL